MKQQRAVTFNHNPLLKRELPPWRPRVVLLALLGGSLALIGRALYLQGVNNEFLQAKGDSRYARVLEVPAIDGSKAKVKVPGGTQTGRRFRLTGKGMPVLRSKQTGDMYVQVSVETPQNLNKRQKELLAEFAKLSSDETQPEAAGFFGRVKDFLDGLGSRGSHSE